MTITGQLDLADAGTDATAAAAAGRLTWAEGDIEFGGGIGLAGGLKDAWLHELRGPDGEWIVMGKTGDPAKDTGMKVKLPGYGTGTVTRIDGQVPKMPGRSVYGPVFRQEPGEYLAPPAATAEITFGDGRKVTVPYANRAGQKWADSGEVDGATLEHGPHLMTPPGSRSGLYFAPADPELNGSLHDLNTYDEKFAIVDYTTTDQFQNIASYLRTGSLSTHPWASTGWQPGTADYNHAVSRLRDKIAAIDSAEQKISLARDTTMYRGIALTPDLAAQIKPGATFTDKNFTSLTTSPQWADDFARLRVTGHDKAGFEAEEGTWGGTPLRMAVHMKAGQHIVPGQGNIGEYILPRGSTFHVDSLAGGQADITVTSPPDPPALAGTMKDEGSVTGIGLSAATISEQLAAAPGGEAGLLTISGQLDLSVESRAKAHATAHATASAHARLTARADALRELRDDHGRWISAAGDPSEKLRGAATGRAARAVRVHDVVLYGKTEMRPGGFGLQSRIVPMEVTRIAHHSEGAGKKRSRFTDMTLTDPETGEEHSESLKDGSSVKLFQREDVRAMLAAERKAGARAPEKGITPPAEAHPALTREPPAAKTPAVRPAAAKAALSGDDAFRSVRRPGNLTSGEKDALAEYGEPDGYKIVNPYLFHDGQVFDSSKMAYRPATAAEVKRAKTMIAGMDSSFAKTQPLGQDIVTYRRMGDTDAMFGKTSAAGKVVRNQAYTSTTTVPGAQTGFGFGYSSKSGNIEVHIPAGSAVLPGNSFEHEVLLPRNAAFRVTKDERGPGGQRNIVMTYDPGVTAHADAPKVPVFKVSREAVPAAAPESAGPAAELPADPDAVKQVDELNWMSSLGGKSTQKRILQKKTDAELRSMDAEYTRRGSASGKIISGHQLVKDEIASRGGKPLAAQSPDEMKKANAAVREAAKKAANAPATKKDLIEAWTHSYRHGIEGGKFTELGDKRSQDFGAEMHRLLSTNTRPAKCGLGCQDAHQFLEMVGREATPQDREMQRGLTLTPAAVDRMFKPGKTLDLPVSSWTTDKGVADSYSKGENGEKDKVKVVLHAAPGAKGLDISAGSAWGEKIGGGEHEVVTGGRFSVGSVKTENGVMHVYLNQRDFSAH